MISPIDEALRRLTDRLRRLELTVARARLSSSTRIV